MNNAKITLMTESKPDKRKFKVNRTYIRHMISSSFLSFHQESYVRQIVPSQCLAQPMAMSLAVVRSWGEQAVSIMVQTSRCCMVCLMPQSQVSGSLENPHFNMFTLDRPTCVRKRSSAFQVVQGFSTLSACHKALPRFEAWHHSEMSIEWHI